MEDNLGQIFASVFLQTPTPPPQSLPCFFSDRCPKHINIFSALFYLGVKGLKLVTTKTEKTQKPLSTPFAFDNSINYCVSHTTCS